MSSGQKMSFIYGFRLALEVMKLLVDSTERIAIAGSIRRGEALVGDIELIMQPRFLAGRNLLEERCEALLADGTFEKRLNRVGNPIAWKDHPVYVGGQFVGNGARFKAATYMAVPLDLFVVLPDRQWGPTMVIRTGPGDANRVLVTAIGIPNALGNRGVCPKGIRFEEGVLLRGEQPLNTPEEWHVFAALNMPWIPPNERGVAKYQNSVGKVGPGPEAVPVDCVHWGGGVYEIEMPRNEMTEMVGAPVEMTEQPMLLPE